jgi:hypothetical protein
LLGAPFCSKEELPMWQKHKAAKGSARRRHVLPVCAPPRHGEGQRRGASAPAPRKTPARRGTAHLDHSRGSEQRCRAAAAPSTRPPQPQRCPSTQHQRRSLRMAVDVQQASETVCADQAGASREERGRRGMRGGEMARRWLAGAWRPRENRGAARCTARA